MSEYKYSVGGKESISKIEEMWSMLNEHHRVNSKNFKERFEDLDFKKRMKVYSHKENIKVHVIIVSRGDDEVGYCLSVIDGEKGEIASLYTKECVRGEKIGEELMRRSLEWLENNGSDDIIIGVACGNEKVLGFYEKFGFYPKNITLSRK